MDDASNLLKPHIFEIFPNLQKVTIRTSEYGQGSSFLSDYSFSWSAFLSLIESGKSSIKYTIWTRRRMGKDGTYSGTTWLEGVSNSFKGSKWKIHNMV
eukprot:868759_1